jgi:hypothetical protein
MTLQRASILIAVLAGLLLLLQDPGGRGTADPLETQPSAAPRPAAEEARLASEAPPGTVRGSAPEDNRVGWLVRVVEDDGRPVPGATVLTTFVAGRLRKRVVYTAGQGIKTDSEGEAFIPHPGTDLPEELIEDLAAGSATPRLALAGMLSEEAAAESFADVDHEVAAPPVRVTLVRPSTGAVVVTVRSPSGPLLPGLTLDLVPQRRPRTLVASLGAEVSPGSLEDGVRFDGIGLGLEFKAYLRAPWSLGPLAQVSLSGPRAQGEVIEVDLVLEELPTGVHLTGRAFGLEGGPLRIVALTPPQSGASETIWSPKGPVVVATLDVQEGELFRVYAPWLKNPPGRVFRSLQRIEAVNAPGHAWQGVLEIQPGQEVVDLGALYLADPTVVVAGTVVDTSGEGVPVDLEVELRLNDDREVSWRSVTTRLRSNADGSFRVLGDYPAGEVWIRIESETWLDLGGPGSIATVPSGTQDATLKVYRTGSVLLDTSRLPAESLQHFTLVVTRPDLEGEEAKRSSQRHSLSRAGVQEVEGLLCGPTRVALEVRGVGTIATWEFVLRHGEPYDLGAPIVDRALHAHAVILESEVELDSESRPHIEGRAGGRRVFAEWTSRDLTRQTFLTAEPLESITVRRPHGAGAHDENGSVTVQPTGNETRVPWPPR